MTQKRSCYTLKWYNTHFAYVMFTEVMPDLQIQQLHYAEEKARADFQDLISRTSNHKALRVAQHLHSVVCVYIPDCSTGGQETSARCH